MDVTRRDARLGYTLDAMGSRSNRRQKGIVGDGKAIPEHGTS